MNGDILFVFSSGTHLGHVQLSKSMKWDDVKAFFREHLHPKEADRAETFSATASPGSHLNLKGDGSPLLVCVHRISDPLADLLDTETEGP